MSPNVPSGAPEGTQGTLAGPLRATHRKTTKNVPKRFKRFTPSSLPPGLLVSLPMAHAAHLEKPRQTAPNRAKLRHLSNTCMQNCATYRNLANAVQRRCSAGDETRPATGRSSRQESKRRCAVEPRQRTPGLPSGERPALAQTAGPVLPLIRAMSLGIAWWLTTARSC
jgi:hypothetical protein